MPSYVDWNDVNEARHLAKHGAPFRFAARIFADDKRIEAPDLRQTRDPPRFNVVGVVDGRTINVTYAMDGDIAVIISARPVSKKERTLYASHFDG